MKTETLQRAKEIEKTVNNLKDRIKAISAIEDRGHECSSIKLEVQSRNGNEYNNDAYSAESSINLNLKEKIKEEMLDCAVRIKRAFEKHIKSLEKEFESL
jgi:hypothetical protein